jgi:hypothetical protein
MADDFLFFLHQNQVSEPIYLMKPSRGSTL